MCRRRSQTKILNILHTSVGKQEQKKSCIAFPEQFPSIIIPKRNSECKMKGIINYAVIKAHPLVVCVYVLSLI